MELDWSFLGENVNNLQQIKSKNWKLKLEIEDIEL